MSLLSHLVQFGFISRQKMDFLFCLFVIGILLFFVQFFEATENFRRKLPRTWRTLLCNSNKLQLYGTFQLTGKLVITLLWPCLSPPIKDDFWYFSCSPKLYLKCLIFLFLLTMIFFIAKFRKKIAHHNSYDWN